MVAVMDQPLGGGISTRKPSADFSDRLWESRQLTGLRIGTNGNGDGIVAPLFQVPKHAHEDGLGLGSVIADVGVAILARDHSRADLAFAVVVVRSDFGMVHVREQPGLMTPQTLHQSMRMALFPRLRQHFPQSCIPSPQ